MLSDLTLDDLDLVELYALRAALLNPECHYDLANGSRYIPDVDSLEYQADLAYLELLIERKIGT